MIGPIRVLVVDDSVVVRGLLGRFIDAEPDLEVVSTAPNGEVGVAKTRSLQPDVIVLDIEMPVMTGIEALAEIRTFDQKVPVIMFSTLTEQGATVTVDALALGASDYATKPSSSENLVDAMDHVRDELLTKIRALGKHRVRASEASVSSPIRRVVPERPPSTHRIDAVVVGSSTGGPVALEAFLGGISEPLPVPMFVVQHMPPTFTAALADRLDRKTVHSVIEGQDGLAAGAGTCTIAPGGFHMKLRSLGGQTRISVFDDEPINSCKPSVEPLFASAVDIYGHHLLAVMLTGMGNDGVDASCRIAQLGADVLVQDEATSVVWGMPGAVADAGAATEVLPLPKIGPRVAELVTTSRRTEARR